MEPWHCPAAFDILPAAAIFSEKGCFQEVAHEKTSFLNSDIAAHGRMRPCHQRKFDATG
jgi:hypothetical protein